MKRMGPILLATLITLGASSGCCLCRPGGLFSSAYAPAPPPSYTVGQPVVQAPPVVAPAVAPVVTDPCCNPCPPCCPPATTAPIVTQ